ncbi:MAG: ATP-dependent RNA helicase dbp4 [Caeruleum heppii]|nr:MAG: ATP-dependent RNA helicase dbp4 [Caeruleum heppii]
MAPTLTGRTKPSQVKKQPRTLKRKREIEDHDALDHAVAELNPREAEIKDFSDLPLSRVTASGLEASHFQTLTDIQAKAVPLALKGHDILGAAKTGSGKTLAFLVPVLENLYRRRWTEMDGLGALIISPTRELAIQIFEVLRKIGRYHTFSAGLIIGGKSLQEEQERLARMNLLVCTPGRILQHLDQTAAFEVDNLQMLVLDEADRLMDMGFQGTVDAIVSHLPRDRQTMLFSATQTKKVSDLARLSLRDPEYVAVHEAAMSATPSTLQQHYIVTPLPEKLNTLFSFIRSNVKSKILVFMASGKQVRFVYESFRHLQPGVPLLHLHGRQKQTARLDITSKFSSAKHSCLLATDVVARGLDFPAVGWVIQLDCPEDADTYIHRVGRTARYERDGRAVLFLEPTEEEGMLKRLEQKKVPIERINVREKKQQSIQHQLQNMCFKDPELKYLGQKAFSSYVRSCHVQKDKEIFQVDKLPLEEFSASLGLPGAPRIKFMKGEDVKRLKNAPRHGISSSEEDEDDVEKEKKNGVRTKYDRMFERRNQDVLADHYSKLRGQDDPLDADAGGDADEDNDFLTVKRRLSLDDESAPASNGAQASRASGKLIHVAGGDSLLIDSKRREKLLKSKKKLLKLKGKGTKLVYDDDGEAHPVYELEDEDQFKQRGDADTQRKQFLADERARVVAADLADKKLAKEKRREKREKRKARELAEKEDEASEVEVQLAPFEGPDQEGSDELDGEDSASVDLKRATKRPKKWFEDDSGDEGPAAKERRRVDQGAVETEDLGDLEALAAGLLEQR